MIENAHFDIWSKDIYGLALGFKVNPSSCGNPEHFENYIRWSAIDDNNSGIATTHVFIDDENHALMGFVSLKASSLLSKEGSMTMGEPALEISNLAVSKDYERRKVGTELILHVIAEVLKANRGFAGIKYIVLAADPKSVGFYEKMEFYKLREYFEIPRQMDNADCVPMFMKIQHNQDEARYVDVSDDE